MSKMEQAVYPQNWTGYTENQQIEFRNILNDHMLLLDHIDGIPVDERFPLLWKPVTRKNQLLPGYDPQTDIVYKLAHKSPEIWTPIRNELVWKWCWQEQQRLFAWQQQQGQMQGAYMTAGQPQMAGFNHPQQLQMNGYNVSVGLSQVPGGYSQAQQDAMGMQNSQATYMPVAGPPYSAVDPSLVNYTHPQNDAMGVRKDQGADLPGVDPSLIDQALLNPSAQQEASLLKDSGLPYDQQQAIIAAATKAAAEQDELDASHAHQTATQSEPSCAHSAADDLSVEEIMAVRI
ncbi:hypothetical protein G6011_04031 [Alternaria panax]|uniref:Uncharacterized protein n=1 Tax=Alternaria panax TaxID=48097 RepID=A0AAD4IGK1_9PLEO|nr:hypothetical protein G6011_04031 [Alternaria panax]